jgi:hypothetical protein
MDFEEALVNEFVGIEGLADKVFPLFTGEGVHPPFLIYISSEGKRTQTLSDFLIDRLIEVEIHVVANNYSELKTIEKEVVDTIISFQDRTIGGEGGPYVLMVDYDQPTEMYEGDTQIYRASFDMRVRI